MKTHKSGHGPNRQTRGADPVCGKIDSDSLWASFAYWSTISAARRFQGYVECQSIRSPSGRNPRKPASLFDRHLCHPPRYSSERTSSSLVRASAGTTAHRGPSLLLLASICELSTVDRATSPFPCSSPFIPTVFADTAHLHHYSSLTVPDGPPASFMHRYNPIAHLPASSANAGPELSLGSPHDREGSVSGSEAGYPHYVSDGRDDLDYTGASISIRVSRREIDQSTDDPHLALTSQTLNADGTPKRPMNAFMIFARKRRPQISAANQMMRTGDISKILSKEWNTMSMVRTHSYPCGQNLTTQRAFLDGQEILPRPSQKAEGQLQQQIPRLCIPPQA